MLGESIERQIAEQQLFSVEEERQRIAERRQAIRAELLQQHQQEAFQKTRQEALHHAAVGGLSHPTLTYLSYIPTHPYIYNILTPMYLQGLCWLLLPSYANSSSRCDYYASSKCDYASFPYCDYASLQLSLVIITRLDQIKAAKHDERTIALIFTFFTLFMFFSFRLYLYLHILSS